MKPMKQPRVSALLAIVLLAPVATNTAAQEPHTHAAHTTPAATGATYSGQQTRVIKALSPQETQDLLDGKGLGLAKAAELNGNPGPMHTLEHADAMKLSSEQLNQTRELLAKHKAPVKVLGSQLVEAEKALDTGFAEQRMTTGRITALTNDIGRLQALIRAEHLRTHLEHTALLSTSQIDQFKALRGYVN